VQSRYPKVVAEEHTIHELPPLTPALPMDEQYILTDSPAPYGPKSESIYSATLESIYGPKPESTYGPKPEIVYGPKPESVYGPKPELVYGPKPDSVYGPKPKSVYGPKPESVYTPKHVPKHYEHDLPVYRDDPKEHLKDFVPHYRQPTAPLSQVKPVISPPPINHPIRQDVSHHRGYFSGIPGIPWKDYPLFSSVPHTSFKCGYTQFPGFYADIEAGCQVYYINYFSI